MKENKSKIDKEICPSCHKKTKRIIRMKISTRTGGTPPITECKNCHKEIKDYWWCENCMVMVEPEHVTFEETHDLRFGGCGYKVI